LQRLITLVVVLSYFHRIKFQIVDYEFTIDFGVHIYVVYITNLQIIKATSCQVNNFCHDVSRNTSISWYRIHVNFLIVVIYISNAIWYVIIFVSRWGQIVNLNQECKLLNCMDYENEIPNFDPALNPRIPQMLHWISL
jgi:hypothetical protein